MSQPDQSPDPLPDPLLRGRYIDFRMVAAQSFSRVEKVSVPISCSASELFSIHQDFSRRREWESGLRDIELIGPERHPRVGLRACIHLWAGITVETEYTAFEPPRLLAIEVKRGPSFVKSFSAIWYFEKRGAESLARVEFELETRPKFVTVILMPMVRWQIRHRLHRLKAYVENRPRQLTQPRHF